MTEGSGVFTQTCTITNTISDRVLEGQVIDQIPVSEDERLRVELLQPMGLRSEGGATACGKGLSGTCFADLSPFFCIVSTVTFVRKC